MVETLAKRVNGFRTGETTQGGALAIAFQPCGQEANGRQGNSEAS